VSDAPRIVDAVFARGPRPRRRLVPLAIGAGIALHGAVFVWGVVSAPSLETWSAELATRVHAELLREQVVELPPPPVEKPPPPPPEREPPKPPPPVHARKLPSPRAEPPPPPAQAAKIVAAEPSAAPVNLADTFVTGTAATYAGGVTSSKGTNRTAVTGPVSTGQPPPPPRRPAPPPPPPGEDLSAPPSVDETSWDCAFPKEADALQIDEQRVLLQVQVRADGTAESARALSDPGHGFAAQAGSCALTHRFKPARDRDGKPTRAELPFWVHFTR
jgi:protein TonB